ncbi:MAG TPA: glycoside hydrolase family 2 TIM barrel-domain containing protein [Flavisolibacter sp.]|nr:glycoside hydrolase family 2 TIM barrel-domain containing protein [Flavisolibacter sp.]
MRKYGILLLFPFFTTIVFSQSLSAVSGRLATPWTDQVDRQHPLPEYPRPQLVRANWINLNGAWKYSILPRTVETIPASFTGNILVPYAVESALSGVARTVGKDSVLWYQRTFNVPSSYRKGKLLLHFGAVDWQCDVYVNGVKAGTHQGGYDPFSFDITSFLKKGSAQQIVVRVWDPSDDGPQPRGKQVKQPHSIWYTPVTGIWQTVWIEPVAATYILSTKQTPDLDHQSVKVSAQTANTQESDQLLISAWDGQQKIAEQKTMATDEVSLSIPQPKLWSPDHPFLYSLRITVVRKGKILDEVKSYFAMRKISIAADTKGTQRMLLNGQFLFQFGPLDQGWWPDGLYTAPTDEALRYDIEKTKDMGFNMIRKHVKVEPARWYYYCDSIGMLVWQDMPSGDLGNRWDPRPGIVGRATDKDRTTESETIYRTEWSAIMQALHNFPCIVVWVPFNEAWGQFKTKEIVQWTMQQDPSRLVNQASGGNFEDAGHLMDLHNYPEPAMPRADLFGRTQAIVLGEFGGLGLPIENHTWQDKNNWGYQTFKNAEELLARYTAFMETLPGMIRQGLSAAVYTQTTDVEIETNGLMTYDRKVIKMPVEKLRALHEKLYQAMK